MPELPEVEIARRNLERWFAGRRVVRAEAERTRTFRGADVRLFEAIRGRLQWATRRGKYLLLAFEGNRGALVHLGMTGKLVKRPAGVAERYSRARLHLDSGEVVHFRDARLFGRIRPAPADRLSSLVEHLGVDPLVDGVSPRRLKEALGGTRREIKIALMDQERIAGLGNIHAAEALYRAGIHPARRPSTLSDEEWRLLARAIDAAIAFALESQKDEEISYVEEPGAENPFSVYGRAGEECRRCGKVIESFVQGGRTTHFCPGCQPRRRRR